MKQALFYNKLKNKDIQCVLCPHFCTIKNNGFGKCRVRKNIQGILYSLSYEQPVAINIDPIEKKPLYHFLPGTQSFSVGMVGCNLRCKHCQNWEMSQRSPEEIPVPNVKAEEIIKEALKSKCPSVSYTYSEPLISYEYVLETAKLAKKRAIKNVIVSNGFINPEPLKELCKYIDGANIDLKSINTEFYEKICEARLQPVQKTIEILHENGVWVELTNLIIPTLNDKKVEIEKLARWVKELDPNIPLHFSAFYPMHKLTNLSPTDADAVRKARKIAMKLGLKYVYAGNIDDEEGNATYCPRCKKAIIVRQGFYVFRNYIESGKCKFCKTEIAGVWK